MAVEFEEHERSEPPTWLRWKTQPPHDFDSGFGDTPEQLVEIARGVLGGQYSPELVQRFASCGIGDLEAFLTVQEYTQLAQLIHFHFEDAKK